MTLLAMGEIDDIDTETVQIENVKKYVQRSSKNNDQYFDRNNFIEKQEIKKSTHASMNYTTGGIHDISVRSTDKFKIIDKYVRDHFVVDVKQDDKIDSDDFRNVIGQAFKIIHDEFYLPISYETMLGYSIEGLGYYVNKLKIQRVSNRILVYKDLKLIGSFSLPYDKSKPDEWVDFLFNVFMKTRNYSDSLVKAHIEEVYFVLLTYLLQSIDYKSEYIHPAKVAKLKRGYSISNSLGFTYRRVEDGIQVLSLLNNSPAFMAGLEEGDLITHLYGELIKNMTDEKIESIIYSNHDTIIHIKYISYTNQLENSAYLRTVSISPNTVSAKFDEQNKIMTVNVSNFVKSTSHNLQTIIDEYQKKYDGDIDGYIIDLRGNTGGVLEEALESANLFISDGLMFETTGKNENLNRLYKASDGDIVSGKPIVVLADGTTKGAAEAFVGVIQSSNRGIMIGSPTYGDGTLQKDFELPNKSHLRLSVGENFLGNGNIVNRIGVFPIVCTSTILDEKDLDVFEKNVLNNDFKVQYQNFVFKKGVINPIDVISKLRKTCLGIYPNMKYINFLNRIAANIIVHSEVYQSLLKKLTE